MAHLPYGYIGGHAILDAGTDGVQYLHSTRQHRPRPCFSVISFSVLLHSQRLEQHLTLGDVDPLPCCSEIGMLLTEALMAEKCGNSLCGTHP
jgi:hypothetical protein